MTPRYRVVETLRLEPGVRYVVIGLPPMDAREWDITMLRERLAQTTEWINSGKGIAKDLVIEPGTRLEVYRVEDTEGTA